MKGEYGVLPSEFCQAILDTIVETKQLLGEIERALLLDGRLPSALRDEMRAYNRKILAYSSDQIVPVRRPFGGRWYDDATVPPQLIAELLAASRGAAAAPEPVQREVVAGKTTPRERTTLKAAPIDAIG